ncbi:RluA family pseudouridine synthase [Brachymonas denitrificans]|uniref:RluA family pseudouridine synthase n=1 Tax=Brachymonas denitrificans TaxID=28220 RepID=UPI00352E3F53
MPGGPIPLLPDSPEIADDALLPDAAAADESALEADDETRELMVDAAGNGQRLDRFLAGAVAEFSRSYLQQLIEAGLLTRNGQPCSKAATKLRAGDRLALVLRATAQSQAFVAQEIPLDIVHEDAHLVIINKPAGMVVHPAAGNWSGTLLNALLHRYAEAAQVPRAGIVHRLDKDTSGLMVVARDRSTMDQLVQQIAAREVGREYWAIGQGHWKRVSEQACSVDAAIGRDPRNRLRMAVVDLAHQSGKTARTDITLVGNSTTGGAPACWVQCKLHTGRTHQIRVHMQHLGHPLLGDATYGGAQAWGMQRQALHAFRLSLRHPVTGQPLQCVAPLPADMHDALQAMGLPPQAPAFFPVQP